MDHCDECQFDFDAQSPANIPSAIRALGGRFAMRISNERSNPALDLTIRTRPGPRIWSALEYACHVRDVFLVERERVYTSLVQECPTVPPMYRDERASLARYAEEEPGQVGHQVKLAAEMLAWAFEGLDPAQWQRHLVCNFPEPCERTVFWLGCQAVHEGEHHLRDIDAALRSAAATPEVRSHAAP